MDGLMVTVTASSGEVVLWLSIRGAMKALEAENQ